MSNLKDLFISQSFYGIVNLENSTSPITSQSGDVELQDGIGTNLGLRTNADNQKFTVVNNFQVDGNAEFNGNIDVSGSWIHTGSIDVLGNVTVEGNVQANIATFDTVNTRLLHVTEESASVIFSSGSNVIGDDITDVQTIVGQTTISGALDLLDGTNLRVIDGDISSSTVSGIGNVTTYSSSVDSRLDALEGPFSTSVDSRLDSLESFETGQVARNSVLGTYTSSVDSSLASINSFTSSTESSLNSLNSFSSSTDSSLTSINSYTASNDIEQTAQNNRLNSLEVFTGSLVTDFVSTTDFNTYTQSTDNNLNQLDLYTASADNRLNQIELTTQSLDNKVDSLISVTGSYATTGSNTFVGDNTFSGSVNGEVNSLTIASQTASLDLSNGNFFTLELISGSDTHLVTSNIQAGQTITLKIKQPNISYGTLSFNDTFKFSTGSSYIATTQPDSIDILTLVTYDQTNVFGTIIKNFV